eukprot:scaffold3.g6234.t1
MHLRPAASPLLRTVQMLRCTRIAALQHAQRLAGEGLGWGGIRGLSELAERKAEPVVYEAPFAGAVRRVKKLSLFSAGCAVAAGPIILGLDQQTALNAKLSIAVTLTSFGVVSGTSSVHNWPSAEFTQPYVQRMVYHPDQQQLDITSLTLFARSKTLRCHLVEVREADSVHPLTNFEVNGRRFYVDPQNFPYKARGMDLLSQIVPQAAAAAAVEAAQPAQQQQGREQQQRQKAGSDSD